MGKNLSTRIFWVSAITLLLTGPVVGIAAGKYVKRHDKIELRLKFADQLTKQIFLLEKQIAALNEVLSGLRSFFESSEAVTREEFGSFTRASLSRHPVIQALEWIPIVEAEQREAHENRTRTAGIEEYRLTARSPNGELIEAPLRERYFPVYYVEPMVGNRPALGYDLASEDLRQRAIYAAMRSPEAVLSDPINLVQKENGNPGMLGFMRVDGSRRPPEAGREDRPPGLVLYVLDLEAVIEATMLADAFLDSASYAFELTDVDVAGTPVSLFRHGGTPQDKAWSIDIPIVMAGQRWHLVAAPREPFILRHTTVNSTTVGVTVAALWELIAILLIAVSLWAKSSSVNRQNRILDSVLLSMAEGVVVADPRGRVVLSNHAAVLMLGTGADLAGNNMETLASHCRLPDRKTRIEHDEFPLSRAITGEQIRDRIIWVPPPNPDADGMWVSANAAPLMSADGTRHGGVLVLRDITDRKRSIEFTERFRNAVEETDDSVFITDRTGVIQYVNKAFVHTTGYTHEEALGRTPRILKSGLTPPDHFAELWSTILNGEVFRRMIANRKKSGAIYYADQTITPMRDLSGAISHFVAVVKDMTEYRLLRQREVEMEIAVDVQKKLYPQTAPPVRGLDIAGTVLSADAACGDYFDFIPISDEQVFLVVGDVSGHGIGSALVMAETRAYIRSLSPADHGPGEILSRVNRSLIQDLSAGLFVTLILARIDSRKGHLVYASAGHDTCFLIDREGGIKSELRSSGMPLGIADLGGYETSHEVPISSGDILVLLTDGLVDCQAHRDRFLDLTECISLIHRHRHESSQAIIDRISTHVRDFMGDEPQNDDITIVVCKVGQE